MNAITRLSVFGLACLPLGLTGCGLDLHPPYSPDVRYGVRSDPVLMVPGAKLADERHDPDRPGVLPMMRFDDIHKPDNPYHSKAKDIKDAILRDPTKISEAERGQIDSMLRSLFGTPAEPTVNAAALGLSPDVVQTLKIDNETLEKGSTRYRVHCLHCHGVPGDGRGPTARWINPHPRDFRGGMFKFASVDQTSGPKLPSRTDLLRTLRHGLEGTAMPAFHLLKEDELESLVSYVIHLSIRGKAEFDLIKNSFGPGEGGANLVFTEEESTIADSLRLYALNTAKNWAASSDPVNAIKVAPYKIEDDANKTKLKESILRGKQLFTADPAHPRGKTANCVSCHADYGRQAKFKVDDWATLVRPNNFTQGTFRGGKRPVDIYYRIHSGITGSGMSSFGATLQPQDIWDLVNFVTVLPYPEMRRAMGVNID